MKAYCVFTDKLEGNHIKLTTEIAQKSRDSMLLIESARWWWVWMGGATARINRM